MFLCVSLAVRRLRRAKTAERIEVLFGVKTLGGQRNIVLDAGPDPPRRGKEDAHSMQTLPNYFGPLFIRRYTSSEVQVKVVCQGHRVTAKVNAAVG